MTDDRETRLRSRLTPQVREAVRLAAEEGRLPAGVQDRLSETGLEALHDGAPEILLDESVDTGPDSMGMAEAIIQVVGRPPLLVQGDAVVMEPLPDFPDGTTDQILAAQRLLPSVGRIEFLNASQTWGGTGWVAERRSDGSALVVTNRHVAAQVARRRAGGQGVFLRSPSGGRCGAAIDFAEEHGSAPGDAATARISTIEYLADDFSADVALLRIETAAFELPDALELDLTPPTMGEPVALIGYPAYDPRNPDEPQARYFRGLYDVKRFAPGFVLQAQTDTGVLTYDCTSLGGNSGSPLIRLSDGKAVGLHFSGLFGKHNTAVSAKTLHGLLAGERPVMVALGAVGGTEGAADGHRKLEELQNREGFDTGFLGSGVSTPWPGLRDDLVATLAEPTDGPKDVHELRYTHFGVKYSSTLKLPLMTAVNIDGSLSVRIKRGRDKWYSDPRIPLDVQLGSKNFQDPEIDRGHMVRREDPNWAPADRPEEADMANEDTFHYVNAAAQHSNLNQGKRMWLGLESHILDSARTHGFRACVFTGPVLRDEEDEEDECYIDGALAPLEFWKLVVTLGEAGRRPHATAYLLSQGQMIRKLLEKRSRREGLEGFVLGAYETFQIAVADLAEATGYDFSAYVDADPLAAAARSEGIETGEPIALRLDRLEDVRL